MSVRLRVLVAAAPLLLVVGCGSDDLLSFGEHTTACEATVLSNDLDDEQKLEEGSNCFLGEVAAGRAVVWDVLRPTVEGDPILIRYDFDGDFTTITTDVTRDSFGSGGVTVQRCEIVDPTDSLPVGVDCTESGGPGFGSDGLP